MKEARSTAEVRRAQAVDAGLRAFGANGLTTAAITQVAAEIGVSQPYIFRLFGGKRDFFLACMDELEARELEAFTGVQSRAGGQDDTRGEDCAGDQTRTGGQDRGSGQSGTRDQDRGSGQDPTGETFDEMGARFRGLVGDGTLGGFSIQALAVARTDPTIAARYRRMLATTLRTVRERTGASGEELTWFLARGVLIVQLQALAVDMTTMTAAEAIEDLLTAAE